MDGRRLELEILARFEQQADEIADEIASSTLAEVAGFGGVADAGLKGEIRDLARRHLDAYLHTARTLEPPQPEILEAARERARQRARELVPLAAQVHSYLIAQRVIGAAIARCADPDLASRDAALALTARTFEYNVAATTAMAEAYVEVVQGDLAELETARRSLLDALLTGDIAPDLARRAAALGFEADRPHAVALALVEPPDGEVNTPRWAAQALAHALGRPERGAFTVTRDRYLCALVDATGPPTPRLAVEAAVSRLSDRHGATLRIGVGPVFTGLSALVDSYHHARRALRHTSVARPVIVAPDDLRLFDELTTANAADAADLIPAPTRTLLARPAMRDTIEALFAANLNVADAAERLSLHPNSLRYRMARIAEPTSLDPRQIDDLVELITAARIIRDRNPKGGDPTSDTSS